MNFKYIMLIEATLKRLHLHNILEKGQKINHWLPWGSDSPQRDTGKLGRGWYDRYLDYDVCYTIVYVC